MAVCGREWSHLGGLALVSRFLVWSNNCFLGWSGACFLGLTGNFFLCSSGAGGSGCESGMIGGGAVVGGGGGISGGGGPGGGGGGGSRAKNCVELATYTGADGTHG